MLSKEKELIQHQINELEAEATRKDDLIALLKNKSAKGIREWELKHEEELANLRKRLMLSSKE